MPLKPLIALLLCSATTCGAAPFAYVLNEKSGTVGVIDTASDTVVRTIATGGKLRGIDLSRDGRLLAAASELANGVVVIDTGAGHASWTLKVPGGNPEHAVFSPDGRWLYVSAEDGAQVDVIDAARRAVAASVRVGRRPRGIADIPAGELPWGVAIR